MSARRKVLEQLLVEASSNNPRRVREGTVQLSDHSLIDWTETSRRGPQSRTGLVDWQRFWDLVDDALGGVS